MIVARFSKEIYDLLFLQKAIITYKKLATIDIEQDEFNWNCRFTDCKYNEERTASEFGNYVIDLMNSKKSNDYN